MTDLFIDQMRAQAAASRALTAAAFRNRIAYERVKVPERKAMPKLADELRELAGREVTGYSRRDMLRRAAEALETMERALRVIVVAGTDAPTASGELDFLRYQNQCFRSRAHNALRAAGLEEKP